jgi:hypothetical protein
MMIPELIFDVAGRPGSRLVFQAQRVVDGGFAGRDTAATQKHIVEMMAAGMEDPGSIPTFYGRTDPWVVQEEEISVVEARHNWGEAEPVLLFAESGTYVTVGSDHPDRLVQGVSIVRSKQCHPNIIARQVWRMEDVADHWDDLVLRAWLDTGRTRLYQEAGLGQLLPPDVLVDKLRAVLRCDLLGTVFYLGSIPEREEIEFAEYFECELLDPKLGRTIDCHYRARPIDWIS